MKIVVNTRLLIKNKLEGIGRFSFETLKRICVNHPEHQFFFVFDRPFDDEFIFSDNVIPLVTGPPARHPVLFYLWFEYSIPKILKKYQADIFLSPDGYLSLRSKTPQLGIMHDLNFEHYPKDLPPIITKYYRHFFPRFAKKSTRICTVSEFSKNDIVEKYDIDPGKIDVIFNGVGEYFSPNREFAETMKIKITGGCEYFIFFGALLPRKNLKNLFLAFNIFKKSTDTNHKLVIAGARKWWTREMEKTFSELEYKDDIIFTGRLPDKELSGLLCGATALTYVSLFEGFGLPILEAFSCQTPVITSNVTAMPEVAADAALLTDPHSPQSIAEAMIKLVSESGLKEELVLKGKVRLKNFSWDLTSDKLWDSIEKTVNLKKK